ncbi:hypothetical protein BCR37DRAFT_395074 [Protomyces lactucae-debilis]|uniref:INO80 complex subunit Ies4-domain-containing protein n=1 Tax=Protomyces lactucae-debilis TaxID=2754530 RepID=A0A1Y2F205_PROLT|nr:uncharacterized protein BCR37DRAFT_395074 [Protomyces lactucae-debilis]ORY76985.1 hypothetical protein BCR37DRAFT_395074 [Protomyces lactucae-debilis]
MSAQADQQPLLLKFQVPSDRLKVIVASSAVSVPKKRARDDAASSVRSSPPPSSPMGSVAADASVSQAKRQLLRKKNGPKRKPKTVGLTEAQLAQQPLQHQQNAAGEGKSKLGPRMSDVKAMSGIGSASGSKTGTAAGHGTPIPAGGAAGHAMPEAYRLLDRSGSKCKRWRPSKLLVHSISGYRWHAKTWHIAKEKAVQPSPQKENAVVATIATTKFA